MAIAPFDADIRALDFKRFVQTVGARFLEAAGCLFQGSDVCGSPGAALSFPATGCTITCGAGTYAHTCAVDEYVIDPTHPDGYYVTYNQVCECELLCCVVLCVDFSVSSVMFVCWLVWE